MLKEKASPEIISKNLAELKANKISQINLNKIVLGADSVIDLDGELISKPKSREEALNILKNVKGIGFIYLDGSDVIRHPLVKQIIEAYEQKD